MVKVHFPVGKIHKKLTQRALVSQLVLASEVLKDSSKYVPQVTGNLRDSGILGTKGKEVIWKAEYAQAQYYNYPNKSKDANPYASVKWFERAKSVRLKAWRKIADDTYNR